MLVGFDTEFRVSGNNRAGHAVGAAATMTPVCACFAFEDGHEVRVSGDWAALGQVLGDRRHIFVVHGCQAEAQFCERVGVPLPEHFMDTLLMSVMLLHAQAHTHGDSVYFHAALARMTARYGIPHLSADDKDTIR